MRTDFNKVFFLISIFFLVGCSAIKQEGLSYKVECQALLSKEFKVKLPQPYHLQKENYEEGVACFYSFADGAYIIVFQGAMMKFTIDNYKPCKKRENKHRMVHSGIHNRKYWRKDIIDGVSVYYDNVTKENKSLYNKILDDISIINIKK
jgi:hypothetical protein